MKNGLVYIDDHPFDILDLLMKFNEMHTKILLHHKLEKATSKRIISLPIYQEVLRVFNEIDSLIGCLKLKEKTLCIDYRLANFPFEYLPTFRQLNRSRTFNLTYTTAHTRVDI